ncbi:hypothetical protein LXL04_021234 [Taraxacum kok-saghyz]
MSDFLPKLSTHTVWLFPMLKKNPPTRSKRQTEAVREIKKLADVMPLLKIPSTTDKIILQTDARDDYWGAILLVEDSSSVRSICGYKSGTFKVSEQHYHSRFKEILAVKRGIEKFRFHLIGHEFLIEMDMASFPPMLHGNLLLNISRERITFSLIFLSRPRDYKSKVTPSTSSKPIKMVHLIKLRSSSSSTEPPLSRCTFPTIEEQIANLPNNIKEAIVDMTLLKRWSKRILLKEALYLFEAHTIAISFNASKLVEYVFHCEFNKPTAQSKPSGPSRNLFTLIEWFLHGHTWAHQLAMVQKKYVVIMFHRPVTYHAPETLRQNQPQLYHSPLSFIYEWSDVNPTDDLCILKNPSMYFRLRYCLVHTNRVDPATIPREIMHELTSWSDKDPVSSHWIQALEEWRRTHLQPRIDTSDDDIDSYADSGYFPDMDETHFDPYEEDPSHEDSR